jgi:hypothetical protein
MLSQQCNYDITSTTDVYQEVKVLLNEIMRKLDQIDVVLGKFDNTLDKIEKEYDPNRLTPQQTGMSDGRCPI